MNEAVRKARVLVVDDDRGNTERMRTLLTEDGHEVDMAHDGVEALERIKSVPPDLVVLDVMMPKMNGLELCRIIKSTLSDRFLPVILVTIKDDIDSKVQGLKIGADDYLGKPYNPTELKARVQSLVRIKQLQDRIDGKRKELEELSYTDGLTGLYNHRFMQQRLAEEFRRAQRFNDPLTCLMIDIDHFKQVNDSHGHPFGDFVLKQVAILVKENLRDIDLVTRYGGDEFLVILPKTHFTGALQVAERLWRCIGTHKFVLDGIEHSTTLSIGLSFYPNRDVSAPEHLIAHADEALYKAKRDGRNRICLYQHFNYIYQPQERE